MPRARMLAVLVAAGLLAAVAPPASAIPATPGSPPDFAHPGSPHYTYHSVESGRNSRPILVLYQRFDEEPIPAGKDAAWAATRFFGGFPSVADYFRANSFGRITFSPARESNTAANGAADDGVVVVDAGAIDDYYLTADERPTDPPISDDDWRRRGLEHEAEQNALALARADAFVDFSSFDRNGDGRVTRDELTIFSMQVSQGTGQFCGAARGVEAGTELDGVLLDSQSVALGGSNTNIITWAHEVMHVALGLDRDWYQFKMETFDVMGETCRPPDRPEAFFGVNAWNKMHLGWISPTVVTRDGFQTIDRADRNPEAFVLHDPGKAVAPTEHYLIVEARVRGDEGSYDMGVGDTGLAIWRIDETRYTENPASALPIWLTRPCWGDPDTGYGGRTDCPNEKWYTDLWDPSQPDTPQRTVNIDWNDGAPSAVAVRAIGASGDHVRAFFDVPGPGVLVDPSTAEGRPMEVRITPDEPTFVRFPVMNTGDAPDEFRFSVRALPPGSLASTDVQDLGDHEESSTSVLVHLAANAPTGLFQVEAVGASASVEERAPFDLRIVLDRTDVAYRGVASAPTGEPAGLRALVTNPDDAGSPPVAGAPVTFQIKGPLGTQEVTATTDATGVAAADPALTLPPGDYTVTASIPRFGKHAPTSVQAGYTVERRPTRLAYTGARSGQYSDPTTIAATLTDALSGAPLSGLAVDLSLGDQDAAGVTDGSGRASATVVIDQPSGVVPVRASFGGTGVYLPADVTDEYAIEKETLALAYTGDTVAGLPAVPRLAALATQEEDDFPGDLSLATATFHLMPTLGTEPFAFQTELDGGGVAETPATGLPVDLWQVTASVPAGNPYWTGSTSTATELALFDPARRLRGDGLGSDSAGGRAMALLADVRFGAAGWEQRTHLDTSAGRFRGEAYDWVIAAGSQAILQVHGTMDKVTPATLRLRISDARDSGGADTFAGRLSGPLGPFYESGVITVTSGNLRVE